MEDIRSLEISILFGIRGMAAHAHHANVPNYEDAEVNRSSARHYLGDRRRKHRSTAFQEVPPKQERSI